MRKNWVLVLLLFVVLGFGVHSPTANAEGFVDVQYDVVMDVTFNNGSAPVAAPLVGVMTIRYEHAEHAGTGTGTTIGAGAAQLRSMYATGPLVLYVDTVLSLSGPTWLTMGPGAVGTWGTSIPFDAAAYTSITKASGLNLPGLDGLLTSPEASCHNAFQTLPYSPKNCTSQAQMPISLNPQPNPTPFTNKVIKGFGNFNSAGPPATLSFRNISATASLTHNLALTMVGIALPIELSALVGTETSRTYVPEPNMALLFGGAMIGLACVGSMRRRKR